MELSYHTTNLLEPEAAASPPELETVSSSAAAIAGLAVPITVPMENRSRAVIVAVTMTFEFPALTSFTHDVEL